MSMRRFAIVGILAAILGSGCVTTSQFEEYARAQYELDLKILDASLGSTLALVALHLQLAEHDPEVAKAAPPERIREIMQSITRTREETRKLLAEVRDALPDGDSSGE